MRYMLGRGHVDLKFLVANLAKSSVKLGGERVATMLHHFVTDGEQTRLRAHEITVLHVLIVDERMVLGAGAYFDSYEAARSRFGLPDEIEPWLARARLQPGRLHRSTARCVLVRSVGWGPGVTPCDCPIGSDHFKLRYRFPTGT